MKRQLSLFGHTVTKRKFFENAPCTPYHQIIERLFKDDDGKRTRSEFQQWAQQQWRDVFKDNEVDRRKLLGGSGGEGSSASETVVSGFFIRSSGTDADARPAAKKPRLAGASRRVAPSMSCPTTGCSKSGAELLSDIGVEPEKLLT